MSRSGGTRTRDAGQTAPGGGEPACHDALSVKCRRVSEWLESLQFVKGRFDAAAGEDSGISFNGADAVEGCIARAVVGELDPTGELALARYPPFLVPGAGIWLAKKGRTTAAIQPPVMHSRRCP